MPIDCDTTELSDAGSDVNVDTSRPNAAAGVANAVSRTSRPYDEAAIREREGLAPNAIILAPTVTDPPMRCPNGIWAMLVSAADIVEGVDPEHSGGIALFAGQWIARQPPAAVLYDGDLVVRLTEPIDGACPLPRDRTVDVEMLLARHGSWRRIGLWAGLDYRWPYIVGPTAAIVMELRCDRIESPARVASTARKATPVVFKAGCETVPDLYRAGLVEVGDVFEWNRPGYVCHVARIDGLGKLVFRDGRAFVRPSGALTALGAKHQNGWNAFRRATDGQTLADLRRQLRAQHGYVVLGGRRPRSFS